MYSNDKITQSIADSVRKVMEEELKGKQHKIDANKNDKIDAHDFELLRKKKKVEEKVVNPYAVGMAAAMKSTGDKPPLKKSTIVKAHDIAKKVDEEVEVQLSFTDLIESYKTGGLKSFFENFEVGVVEEEATSDEFVAELEKAKRKAAGKEKNEVAKAAVQAVQQEEVEQIDELSKATLGSYIQKASKKAVSHQRSQSDAERTAEIDKKQPLWKKMAKHHFDKKQLKLQGISRAASNLAKEEAEHQED